MRRLLPLVIFIAVMPLPARADRIDDLALVLANDGNWKVRMQAASVLGRLHDQRGVPPLLRALADKSESVRGVAAGALGEIGDQSAAAALQRALRDPSELVRDQAQVALDSLRVTPAAPVAAARPAAPPPAGGGEARPGVRVEVGAITSRTSRLPGDLAERLRRAVVRNLGSTPGVSGAPSGGSYILDTSVTRLTRHITDTEIEIECEVSLILGRLPGKAIVLTTSGGATSKAPRGEGRTPAEDQALIVDALEGAVTGAWANVAAFFSKTSARR